MRKLPFALPILVLLLAACAVPANPPPTRSDADGSCSLDLVAGDNYVCRRFTVYY